MFDLIQSPATAGIGIAIGIPVLALIMKKFLKDRKSLSRTFGGKNIIITGASSGIGRQFAIMCAQLGSKNIVITARREQALAETKRLCEAQFQGNREQRVHVMVMDVSLEKDCKRLVETSVNEFFAEGETAGRIDHLILNAGVGSVQRFSMVENLDAHRRAMDINYFGCVMPTFYALPYMKAQAHDSQGSQGTITVVSSLAGKTGVKYRTAYSPSKHALHGFYDSLRIELADEKTPIQITVLCPGFVITEIHDRAMGGSAERDLSKFMKVEDAVDEMLQAIASGTFEYIMGRAAKIGFALRGFLPLSVMDALRARTENATKPKTEA